MIISVFPYLEYDNSVEVTKNVLKELKKYDTYVIIDEECKGIINRDFDEISDSDSMMKKCDVAIAIGGDGTTLRVAKKAALYDKEVLDINGGHLGFMSGLEKNELHLIKNLIDKNYSVEKRLMLKAEVIKDDKVLSTQHCLNDAVITRGDFARLIDVEISSENRSIWSIRGDGVIISTPTGSTAYSMAAGGPVVSPDTSCFIVTSICPHALVDRSLILPCDKTLVVKTHSDTKNNSILTADGKMPINIRHGTEVHISLSNYKASLIKIKPDNFYDILKKKIIERRA